MTTHRGFPTPDDLARIAERRERVAELTRQGLTAAMIAEHLHVTERTVVRDRAATGCPRPAPNRLTDDQVLRARELLDDGCSVKEAARTVGCSDVTLHRRFPGRAWTRAQVYEHMATMRRWRRMTEQHYAAGIERAAEAQVSGC